LQRDPAFGRDDPQGSRAAWRQRPADPKKRGRHKPKRDELPVPGDRVQMDTCKPSQFNGDRRLQPLPCGRSTRRRSAHFTLAFLDQMLDERPISSQRVQTDRGTKLSMRRLICGRSGVWSGGTCDAACVMAKGVHSLAGRIRNVAEANGMPLVATPPLARALYRVEVDADIPAEHYQAVAEIIVCLAPRRPCTKEGGMMLFRCAESPRGWKSPDWWVA
jgi:type III secretion system FlhB-like substrate exporter